MANKYQATGKIHPVKTILAFLIALPAAVLCGALYGALTNWIPYIIIDLIVFGLGAAGIAGIIVMLVKIGAVRNKKLKFLLSLVICFVAWYASWVYIVSEENFFTLLLDLRLGFAEFAAYQDTHTLGFGAHSVSTGAIVSGAGMWVIAGIEFVLIFVAAIAGSFSFSKDYYCETCQKFNTDKEFFVYDVPNESNLNAGLETGDFRSIADYPRWEDVFNISQSVDLSKKVFKVEVSHCSNCGGNGVINIQKGVLKEDSKTKRLSFESETDLVEDVLISDLIVKALVGG